MAFSCGMLVNGEPCLHESRRKALDCTRRKVAIDNTIELESAREIIKKQKEELSILRDRVKEFDAKNADLVSANEDLEKRLAESQKAFSGLTDVNVKLQSDIERLSANQCKCEPEKEPETNKEQKSE